MIDIFKSAERLMAMDDATWARHANPWSVYTRFSCLPLFVLAIWSRVWFGWWALILFGLVVFWTWANPRLFGPPSSLDSWAAQGVMGERVFLDRKRQPVAEHHVRMAYILTTLSVIGLLILTWGLISLDLWAAICGLVLAMISKVWFVDRMVWIFQDQEGQP